MTLYFWTFVAASVALIVTPGADTALVTKNTVTHTSKGGFWTACGVSTGILVHTVMTGLGLSMLLLQSAELFTTVKLIGAAYLIYLGVRSMRTRTTNEPSQSYAGTPSQSAWQLYKQGLFTNVFNPKVALFFFTFLPQFTDHTQAFFPQVLLLGVTYCVLTQGWFMCYIRVMQRFKAWFDRPSVQRYFERVTGVVLIGLGVKLALDRQ